ncbi:FixH family protein [bacterium]|nr:FixH family protein [bacterium]
MPETQELTKKSGEPWAIGIALVLVVFVISLVGFIIFASLQSRDLVEDRYYERGLEYDSRIDELERSQQDSTLAWKLDAGKRTLTFLFPGDLSPSAGFGGQVVLYRPSDASMDRSYTLEFDASGEQIVDLRDLQRGNWKAKISWTVNNEDYYQEAILFLP